MFEEPILIPRHAFSVRDAARAGDVWRAFQELAVDASTARGWPPSRYREEGAAFIVRSMCVRHALEPFHGEPLVGRTWISRVRRDTFSTREVRLVSRERGLVATGRQEWVHVRDHTSSGGSIEPARASEALKASFPAAIVPDGDTLLPELPSVAQKIEGAPVHAFEFEAWWTWMDPLDHANHPAYLDWCDEALSRVLVARGASPVGLTPVAEELIFRHGARAGERVRVESRLLGLSAEGDAVVDHRIFANDALSATGTTVRRMRGEEGAASLARALSG